MTAHVEHDLTGTAADVADCMIEAEANVHAEGWDNTPLTLYIMMKAEPEQFHVATVELGGGRERIEWFADMLDTAEAAPGLSELLAHPPIASFVVAEVWKHGYLTEQERAGRDLADIPGSVEARFALGVTDQTHVVVERQRGSVPTCVDTTGDGNADFAGPMMDALIRLYRSVGARYTALHGS